MPGDIQNRTLLVVSDTPAVSTAEGVHVYEPVYREMIALSVRFDNIIWLASDAGDRRYALVKNTSRNIRVIVMPSVYHKKRNWLYGIINYPAFIAYILTFIKRAGYVHARGPSHPALITIMLSLFDVKRKYWYKYAGNWSGKRRPFTYKLQKMLLAKTKDNCRITVNGKWENMGRNVLSFENPCFTEEELRQALTETKDKDFDSNLVMLFVGNLYTDKGVLNLTEALKGNEWRAKISECYIIGDGPLYSEVLAHTQNINGIKVTVTGKLNRESLNEYYKKAHFLILPSQSEGFPKVIAEAASYGCIPIVPDISAIPQYIQTGINGYLLSDNTPETIKAAVLDLITQYNLKELSRNVGKMCSTFTYEYYTERVRSEIYQLSN